MHYVYIAVCMYLYSMLRASSATSCNQPSLTLYSCRYTGVTFICITSVPNRKAEQVKRHEHMHAQTMRNSISLAALHNKVPHLTLSVSDDTGASSLTPKVSSEGLAPWLFLSAGWPAWFCFSVSAPACWLSIGVLSSCEAKQAGSFSCLLMSPYGCCRATYMLLQLHIAQVPINHSIGDSMAITGLGTGAHCSKHHSSCS